MKNKKEFERLIERYESITLDDIQNIPCWNNENEHTGYRVAGILTGFGERDSCTLCIAVNGHCSQCTWYVLRKYLGYLGYPCNTEETSETYEDIEYADTPGDLLLAFKNRAEHMRNHLKKVDDEK